MAENFENSFLKDKLLEDTIEFIQENMKFIKKVKIISQQGGILTSFINYKIVPKVIVLTVVRINTNGEANMIMRKIVFGLLAFSLIFTGCENYEPSFQNLENSEVNNSVNEYARSSKYTIEDLILNPELIGQIHNEEMNFIYEKLVLIRDNELHHNNMSIEEFIHFHIVESLKQKIELDKITNIDDFILKSDSIELNEIAFFQNELHDLTKLNLSIIDFKLNSKELYNKYAITNNDVVYQFNLKLVLSIADSSFEYWHLNQDKWSNLLNSTNTLFKRDSGSNGRIVRADIYGGVRGAVSGAITGAVAGGVGAVPAAVVGGLVSACVSSSAAGIREHLGYTTWWPF